MLGDAPVSTEYTKFTTANGQLQHEHAAQTTHSTKATATMSLTTEEQCLPFVNQVQLLKDRYN
jgi:hypothetical protein